MKYLITGGCGFLGSNLAEEVLKRGEELFIFDNLFRLGSEQNLKWLQSKQDFKFYRSDIRSYNDVEFAVREVKPDVIFHLAGQVAMTTSLQNPRLDFEINVLGGNNLLEAVRKFSPDSIITYSSTNKVYGDFDWINFGETPTRYVAEKYKDGFDETIPLDFQSPYGCSKGATDQYMLDYAKMFGIKTVVFRHSSIFGGRQFATIDQGWVGWFVKKAIEKKQGLLKDPFTISGSGKQVRDLLFIDDLINCYFGAVKSISKTAGNAYNIGGGMHNSLSLLELFDFLNIEMDIKLDYTKIPVRKSDQKVFVANTLKSLEHFNWKPSIDTTKGIQKMISWISESSR